MRLLLITQDFPPDVGGTQTYAFELAKRLAPRCDDFAVVAPLVPGAEAVDAALPFEVVRVAASHSFFPIKAYFTLRRLARERAFDTAFHVQWQAALPTLLARRSGWPRRIFVAAHGRELLFEPTLPAALLRYYNRLRRRVLNKADRLFPVSHFTGALLEQEGVTPEAITVLHNGTDPNRFAPRDASSLRAALRVADRKVILTICRLVPRKGVDLVIRALPRVIEALPDAVYLIGGTGPDEQRLRALVEEMGVQEQVRFLGKIPHGQLAQYYNAADLFVMPARHESPHVEGFGIVYLEANACGVPVIGGRSGGVPDAVRDGETGMLVDPLNAAELTAAITHLLSEPDVAARLGNQGRNRVLNEGSWDGIADQLFRALTVPV